MKEEMVFTVVKIRKGKRTDHTDTIPNLIKYFGYTLEVGKSHDKKINTNPKNIQSLINNLNRSKDAATGNGYNSMVDYYTIQEYKEIKDYQNKIANDIITEILEEERNNS